MADQNDYLRTGESTFRLRADVLTLMMKGAGYAAAFCVALGLLIWIVYAIGQMLPEESKEADDPTPYSFNLTDHGDTTA